MSDAQQGQMVQLLSRIERTLNSIELALGAVKPAVRLGFFVEKTDGTKQEVKEMFMQVGQTMKITVAPLDANDNPAKVDGAPKWALSDESLGTLTVAEDGMSAMFVAGANVGTLKVQASADADLTEGVKTILAEMEVSLLPLEAVKLAMAGEIVA